MSDPAVDPTIRVLLGTATASITLFGALISAAGYFLNRRQREDVWLRTFAELHKEFWTDDVFATVRSWLACDQAYASIRPVLEARRRDPASLDNDDYRVLEKFDRFLNFMSRVGVVAPMFKGQRNLWRVLFFDYWIRECTKQSRSDLKWYLETFYSQLLSTAESLGGTEVTSSARLPSP